MTFLRDNLPNFTGNNSKNDCYRNHPADFLQPKLLIVKSERLKIGDKVEIYYGDRLTQGSRNMVKVNKNYEVKEYDDVCNLMVQSGFSIEPDSENEVAESCSASI